MEVQRLLEFFDSLLMYGLSQDEIVVISKDSQTTLEDYFGVIDSEDRQSETKRGVYIYESEEMKLPSHILALATSCYYIADNNLLFYFKF